MKLIDPITSIDSIKLEKSTDYLLKHIVVLKNHKAASCIVEKNEVKLGGSALAMLALIEQYQIKPQKHLLILLRKLASFLLWMQEPSGKFKSKFSYPDTQFSIFDSNYYPGEAILALTRLYSIDPNPKWIQSAIAGANFLIKNPVKGIGISRGHNHWFAIALEEIYHVHPIKKYSEELWLIADSTNLATQSILNEMSKPTSVEEPYSSAAMATRGESIIAGVCLELKLKKRKTNVAWLNTLGSVISYCLTLKVREDMAVHHLKLVGGIMKSQNNSNIRIDYVQHVLSVIIGLIKIRTTLEKLEILSSDAS